MKKYYVIIILLFLSSIYLKAQKEYSLKIIDDIQKETNDNYFHKWINSNELSFVISDWLYVLSYEDENDDSRAFLYRREINQINSWTKADNNPVFQHGRGFFFDKKQSNSQGISSVEIIKTNYGTCVLMFIGTYIEIDGVTKRFTHFVFFYPSYINQNKSIQYNHISKPYNDNNGLKYFFKTGRKNNLFYTTNKSRYLYVDYKNNSPFMIMYDNNMKETGFFVKPF